MLTAGVIANTDWTDVVLDNNANFDPSCEYRATFRCHATKCSQIGESWQNYPIIVSSGKLIFKVPGSSGVGGNILAIIWTQDKHYSDLVKEDNFEKIASEKHYEIIALQKKCNLIEQAQQSTLDQLKAIKDIFTPVGAMLLYGGINPPNGYLLCDGQAVARTAYPELFAIIGVAFGKGDGITTFNLPDFRGRVPAGYIGGANNLLTKANALAIGGVGGTTDASCVLNINQIPPHTHTYTETYPGTDWLYFQNASVHQQYQRASNTGSTGNGEAHSNIMPFMFTNVIIKAL